MRYDSEHKERTRRSILEQAAQAIRMHGPEGVGVAEIMAALGLTHGGFYAHFKSKDELIAQSIAQMFEDGMALFQTRTAGQPPAAGLARYIDAYLSRPHRDERGRGCPVAALAADLPRLTPAARERFGEGVQRMTAGIAGLLAGLGRADATALAESAVAEMTGALALSRALADKTQSDRLLRNSRAMIKARLGLVEK